MNLITDKQCRRAKQLLDKETALIPEKFKLIIKDLQLVIQYEIEHGEYGEYDYCVINENGIYDDARYWIRNHLKKECETILGERDLDGESLSYNKLKSIGFTRIWEWSNISFDNNGEYKKAELIDNKEWGIHVKHTTIYLEGDYITILINDDIVFNGLCKTMEDLKIILNYVDYESR